MSTTLTVDDMVAKIQLRVPMGVDSGTALNFLNEAWRKIESQGSFLWNVRTTPLTMTAGTNHLILPAEMDCGKPAAIYISSGFRYPITYVPFEEYTMHLTMSSQLLGSGLFSVWTIDYPDNLGNVAVAFFAPAAVIDPLSNTDYSLWYHKMVGPPLTLGASYFPTPDAFDDTIVDLAEGLLKETYNIVKWEMVIKKAETSMRILIDRYRSTKERMAGLSETAMAGNEKALEKAG